MIPGSSRNHPDLFKSFAFAWQGLRFAFKTERNIKVMLTTFLVSVVLGFLVRFETVEWACFFIGSGVVFCAELFNTALETVVDLVSPEYNDLAGHAKDLSAAAVNVLCILVGIAGVFLFMHAIVRLF